VWWALCLLDTSLSTITGRPPGISGEFNTTPLPIPFEEEDLHSDNSPKYIEDRAARNSLVGKFLDNKDRDTTKESFTNNVLLQRTASKHRSLDGKPTLTVAKVPPPNDSLCFFYAARLTTIMREVLHTLYAPGVAYNSWREIELARSSLNTKVDIWHSSLPASYKFPSMSGAESIRHQSVKLAFQFYSTKLYITRPCLRRLAASSAEESDSPTTASDPMQEICIQAVCRLIDILPDEPDLTWLYGVCPIWCALHYLIQALNVMLTESFISAKLGTSQIICILPRLRKARAWLEELSKTNTSARKARMIFSDLISRHGSRLGLDG
jgi:hypothetical protein